MTGGHEDMRTRRQKKGGQDDGRTGKQEGMKTGGKEDRRT